MEKHNIRLTSSELSNLWANYIGDSMSICIFKHFLAHIDDTQIKGIVDHAMDLSQQHISKITAIFEEEGIAVPLGFTSEDVNEGAPRLFSDEFYLHYIKNMTKGSLTGYGAVLPMTFRNDIREYYMSSMSSSMELFNDTTNVLLSKGLEVRAPYIPYPAKVEFVEKESFLAGWLGEQRPLLGVEVSHLFANIQTNRLGEAITLGFAQTAKLKEVKEFLLRGKEIAKKHVKIFSRHLQMEELPAPMTSDAEVTTSTESTFSDKLMMYHIGLLSATGMGNYGAAMSLSPRRDLVMMYGRLLQEVGLYAEDGTNINIKHSWLEKPPQAADRDELTK